MLFCHVTLCQGCMKLSNGVLYRQLKAGAGKRPGTNSSCVCVCKGTLVDGTVFFNGSARSADGAGCTLVPRSLVQVRASGARGGSTVVTRCCRALALPCYRCRRVRIGM